MSENTSSQRNRSLPTKMGEYEINISYRCSRIIERSIEIDGSDDTVITNRWILKVHIINPSLGRILMLIGR